MRLKRLGFLRPNSCWIATKRKPRNLKIAGFENQVCLFDDAN